MRILMQTIFDLQKEAKHTGGRKPIKDRGIRWEESYHDKTASLKEKFEKEIGPDAYLRYEGHDHTTNSDYYVVVGPSVEKNMGKCFFAGVKKLPPPREREGKTFSPYGEYFKTMKAAHSYATEKWGVPMKKGLYNYTVNDLANVDIPQHIKG
jgi:hypothetical protein